MGAITSQITSLTIVYSTVYSDTNQRKHQSKLRVTGLCAGNSPGTGEFPAQRASYAENVSIWWRHHASLQQLPGALGYPFPIVTSQWAPWRLKSPASRLLAQGGHKRIKAPRHLHLLAESTGPVTWKMFPFDDVIMQCLVTNPWSTNNH